MTDLKTATWEELLHAAAPFLHGFALPQNLRHLAGQHSQKTHGHGHQESLLFGGIESGVASSEVLVDLRGNPTRKVELVTFKDGTKAIRKTGDDIDQEHLGTLVSGAVGAPVPAVIKQGNALYIEHIPGVVGGRATGKVDYDSPQARAIGLADVVTGNFDRNGGNYIVKPDGTLVGIDHGHAFHRRVEYDSDGQALPPQGMHSTNPFVGRYIDAGAIQRPGRGANGLTDDWALHNPAKVFDLLDAEDRLENLRSEFTSAGHEEWLDDVIVRLQEVRHRARG